uniref:TIGR03560 family F420-dependent LLM class oxidoreductase n=1 Tax=Mycobacterium avium TaxID=1764 RepID=UPI000AA016EF
MELGLHFIDFLPGDPARLGPTLSEAARAAEQGGATLFTLADHFFQMEQLGPAENPFLEGYTSLGFLAAQTSTIELALLVTGVTYRYPGVLAKTVTTLDVLSQGRSILGLGAAWYEREHTALGIPYPALSTRFEMLEETLQICLQMWSDDNGAYQGKHYRLAETICAPQPIRRPPIRNGGPPPRRGAHNVFTGRAYLAGYATSVFAHHRAEDIQVSSAHCHPVASQCVRDPAHARRRACPRPPRARIDR